MELEAKKRHIRFFTALASMKSKWDIYTDEDDFLEIAYPIWREIGNIASEDNNFEVKVPTDGIVQLPDNCEFVSSVKTFAFRDVDGFNESGNAYSYNSNGILLDVSPNKSNLSQQSAAGASENYNSGDDVNWTNGNGFIRVTSGNMVDKSVHIYYKSIYTDEDGLPFLDDKELKALTYNVALVLAERDLFRKIPGADVQVKYLKPLADVHMAAAKIPEKISDDALNRVLDAKIKRNFKTLGNPLNFN